MLAAIIPAESLKYMQLNRAIGLSMVYKSWTILRAWLTCIQNIIIMSRFMTKEHCSASCLVPHILFTPSLHFDMLSLLCREADHASKVLSDGFVEMEGP